jgi:hypothetical protein
MQGNKILLIMEDNMPKPINDHDLKEIKIVLFGTRTRQPSDLLSAAFQQALLNRYAPGLPLDSLLPEVNPKTTGSFCRDRRDSDSRSCFFHLFRYAVLKSACETENCEQIAGAIDVCFLCNLDQPFDHYDFNRTEQRFSCLLNQELQTFLIDLGTVVDKEINPLLPANYRLRFPHMDTLVFRGFSKTSIGKYRKIFMETLHLNFDIARAIARNSKPESSSKPPLRKNLKIITATTVDSDPPQLDIIRHSTVRQYENLPAPSSQRTREITFAQRFEQLVAPVYPFSQTLGRHSPVTILPQSLYLPPTLHPVSLEPTALQTDKNISVSMEDLASGCPPYHRTMILGEVGSGRTTLARQLGTMIGLTPSNRNTPSFLLYIDCENPANRWLQQSPYEAAAEILQSQDCSLFSSREGLPPIVEQLSLSGRALWVLDHLFEDADGKMPRFLRLWSRFLGGSTRIILIPESQNRYFLEELLTIFYPIPSILCLQPLSPEQQLAFISHYAKAAAPGYLPGGDIYTLANMLVDEEQAQIKSSTPIMADILRIQAAAESNRSEILQAASRLQTLSTRQIPASVSLNTPLAALSYCMKAEMGKWDDNDRYLLLLFMERYGLLNHSSDQPLMFPLKKAADTASSLKCALGKIALGLAGKPKEGTENGELFTQTELEHWLSPIPGIELSQIQDNLIHTRIIKRSCFNQDVFQFTYPSFQTIIAGEYSRYLNWKC